MATGEGERVPLGELHELGIRSREAHEGRARRLAEPKPELRPRHGGHQRLVEVLHRLDEVGLPEDQVHVIRLLDPHRP